MRIVGTDEAGRGPIAGPVMAAAAMLEPPQFRVLLGMGLADSKRLTERKRERLFLAMKELGVIWAAQAATHEQIDQTNILAASLWAMSRSIEKLELRAGPADLIVVDGNIKIPDIASGRQKAIPRADALVPAVMAASVIAKVLRDRAMKNYDRLWPDYGFAKHKGYPTAAHRAAVDMLGPSPIHRLSFGGYKH